VRFFDGSAELAEVKLRMHSSFSTVIQNDNTGAASFTMGGARHVVAQKYNRSDGIGFDKDAVLG